MKLFIKLLPMLSNLKSWVFADGKFSQPRALILVLVLTVCIIGSYFIGVDNMNEVVKMMDDISDSIGYSD